jgi:uncharacterized protein (DUF58 family)
MEKTGQAPPAPQAADTDRFLAPRERLDLRMLAELPDLPLRSRYLVESLINSSHRSSRRGCGIEFSDYRAYQAGDDLRRVDWRLYARADRIYLKRFEEETQMRLILALDVSASMSYRGPRATMSKGDFARTTLGAMAMMAVRQNDAVGAALLGGGFPDYVRPRSSSAHLTSVFSLLDSDRVDRQGSLPDSLSMLVETIPSGSIIVIASDFYDSTETLGHTIGQLRHRGNDVIGLQIVDPSEADFDLESNGILVDLETGDELPVEPDAVRKQYLEAFLAFQGELAGVFSLCGVDLVTMRTDESPVAALSTYLAKRSTRI